MAVSLLGYFGCVGAAFTAMMALLFSLLVNSSALERIHHYPCSVVVRTVTADNEAHRRLLKREANLEGFCGKRSVPAKERRAVSPFTAQTDIDKSKQRRDTGRSE